MSAEAELTRLTTPFKPATMGWPFGSWLLVRSSSCGASRKRLGTALGFWLASGSSVAPGDGPPSIPVRMQCCCCFGRGLALPAAMHMHVLLQILMRIA